VSRSDQPSATPVTSVSPGWATWRSRGRRTAPTPPVDQELAPPTSWLTAGDHVCWGDPSTGRLHEGIVRRTFDRFVEVAHLDECDQRQSMVYRTRLAALGRRFADSQ
jgi:hypothetical protein